jgi:prepilin-type N-terminal cleavage/methylation domain-containing protein
MKRGFSLLEVMIASSMLLVGIAGIVVGTTIATQQHEHDRKVAVALIVAERRMEELLLLFPASLDLTSGRHPADDFETFDAEGRPGGTAYRLFYTATPPTSAGAASIPGTVLEVTIAWDESMGERSIQLRTVR